MNYRDPDENSDYKLPSREESFDFIETKKHSKPTSKFSGSAIFFNTILPLLALGATIYLFTLSLKAVNNLSEVSSNLKNIIINSRTSNNSLPLIINNPNNLSKEEIKSLIDFYGLNIPREVNKEIFLDEKDVDRWHTKKLTLADLQEQFRLMRLLVDEYEKRGTKIQDKDYLYRKLEEVNRIIESQQ